MAYAYEQLSKMTVAQLREVAAQNETEELTGVSTMRKEKLLPLLCKALHVEIPHHHVEGIDKTKVKQQIRELKKERDGILSAKKGKKELRVVLDKIHALKSQLRKHLV